MKVTPKMVASVLALPGLERYGHFIKVVADWQQVWGLYHDGWALASSEDGTVVFPMWPAREYAEACANNNWSGYEPRAFDLDELLNDLLPKLERDRMMPGIFFTPQRKGVTPSVSQFRHDLDVELEKY